MAFSKKSLLVAALVAIMLMPVVSAAVDVDIKVVDKDGEEIEDANIVITNSSDDQMCDEDTDDDGEAQCNDLEDADDSYRIRVTHADYKEIDDDEALEDLDDDADILVVMRPKEFDLEIEVVDQNGDAIENADVTVRSLDEELDDNDVDPDEDYDIIIFPDEKSKYEPFEIDEDDETDETDEDGLVTFKDLEWGVDYEITVEKRGFQDTTTIFDSWDRARDEDIRIEMIEPGTATLTAVVRDLETNEFIEGATVQIMSRDNASEETGITDTNGAVSFEVDTPACYDIAVTKDGYSTDSQTNLCLENDDEITGPFYLTAQNNPPVADAGEDQYVMVGDVVTLDASGSSDPDGDELTYTWEDSFGQEIPDGVNPQVVFDSAREHVITLTVSDGRETATDTVTVVVDSPQNCGDGVCSLSEKNAEGTDNACPVDCPVCKDDICGAGEGDPGAEQYCPVDCGIRVSITTINSSALVAGNSTTIITLDPNTGGPVEALEVKITAPNGSVATLTPAGGQVEYKFSDAGVYRIEVTAERYLPLTTTIEVRSTGGGWLLCVVVIIVVVVVILFIIRLVNKRGFGLGGKRGYRAKRYRRRKPTLSSV